MSYQPQKRQINSRQIRVSRRLWTCLCGNTLYFFNSAKDTHYVEKLDLSGFVSLIDDCSRDRNLEAARVNLRMKDGEIKLTAPNLEARELWKGFLYSVVDVSTVLLLHLYSAFLPLMIRCFRPVSRTEAEVLLERHPDSGNMLLRPGRDGTSLAVTTRQDLNGSVFRHYRVTQKQQGGYIIDVENPIPCPTLHDVINALVEKTAGTLQPFLLEEPYEENITYISSNDENGERTLHCAPTSMFSRGPALPPKAGPERWTLRSQTKSPSPSTRSLSPPGSPSSPLRRLVLSPSPLKQSECSSPALYHPATTQLIIYITEQTHIRNPTDERKIL
uniref:Signal transducing adaptor family member 2a n=1 Tax=Astyanax mexicanus TaxID=7994 RepID=A0A8B9H5L6_ASTMX